MRIVSIVIYLLIILLGAGFAALNSGSLTINFYYTNISLPTAVWLVFTLCIGMLCGVLLVLFRYLKLRMSFHKIKRQLELTEREIKNLRSIPLQDQH